MSRFRQAGWLVTASLSVEVSREDWRETPSEHCGGLYQFSSTNSCTARSRRKSYTRREYDANPQMKCLARASGNMLHLATLTNLALIMSGMSLSASKNARWRILMHIRTYMVSIPTAHKFYYISYTWKEWTATKFLYWIWTWTCNTMRTFTPPIS